MFYDDSITAVKHAGKTRGHFLMAARMPASGILFHDDICSHLLMVTRCNHPKEPYPSQDVCSPHYVLMPTIVRHGRALGGIRDLCVVRF